MSLLVETAVLSSPLKDNENSSVLSRRQAIIKGADYIVTRAAAAGFVGGLLSSIDSSIKKDQIAQKEANPFAQHSPAILYGQDAQIENLQEASKKDSKITKAGFGVAAGGIIYSAVRKGRQLAHNRSSE